MASRSLAAYGAGMVVRLHALTVLASDPDALADPDGNEFWLRGLR
jgi:hypothetical protein